MKNIKTFKQFLNENLNESQSVKFKGKKVNIESLEIDGLDYDDYPQFSDAFFASGKYSSGQDMTDNDLDKFSDENPDLINRLATEQST